MKAGKVIIGAAYEGPPGCKRLTDEECKKIRDKNFGVSVQDMKQVTECELAECVENLPDDKPNTTREEYEKAGCDTTWLEKGPTTTNNEFTEHHSAEPIDESNIPNQAANILETAAGIIRARNKSYNRNGIKYEDFVLRKIDTIAEDVMECLARLYNGDEDSAYDMCSYVALMVSYIQMGMPQSRFNDTYDHFITNFHQRVKEVDTMKESDLDIALMEEEQLASMGAPA